MRRAGGGLVKAAAGWGPVKAAAGRESAGGAAGRGVPAAGGRLGGVGSGRVARGGRGRVADRGQALDQVLGHLAGRLDQHGAVQVAAPLAAEQVGALGVVGDAAEDGGRGVSLAEHVLHLAEGSTELLVLGDHHDAYPEAAPAAALGRRREGGGAVTQPDHVGHVHLADQDDRGRLDEQVVERAVRAEPAAVSDDVRLRQRGQRLADRAPEQAQAGALLRVGHAGQHVEAAVQLLHMLPDLLRLHAAPGDHGQAEHSAPGVEVTAAGRGEAVDEVPSGLIALGQQDRARPHSGERQCRCRDTWRSLVGRDSDQRHAHPDPGVNAMATSPAEA